MPENEKEVRRESCSLAVTRLVGQIDSAKNNLMSIIFFLQEEVTRLSDELQTLKKESDK